MYIILWSIYSHSNECEYKCHLYRIKVFFQSLLKDISNIPENELRQKIKPTFRVISTPKVVIGLSDRRDIAILKPI